jgi:hypothetical protein
LKYRKNRNPGGPRLILQSGYVYVEEISGGKDRKEAKTKVPPSKSSKIRVLNVLTLI